MKQKRRSRGRGEVEARREKGRTDPALGFSFRVYDLEIECSRPLGDCRDRD